MTTPDISRDTYRPEQHYNQVVFQQKRFVLDAELNETQSLLDEQITNVSNGFGRFVVGTGFKVIPVSDPNEILIAAGKIGEDGQFFYLDTDTTIEGLNTPYGSSRIDYAFARITLEFIDSTQDPVLKDPALGEETAIRSRYSIELGVAEGELPPAPSGTEFVIPLAKITRTANSSVITESMIEDLRHQWLYTFMREGGRILSSSSSLTITVKTLKAIVKNTNVNVSSDTMITLPANQDTIYVYVDSTGNVTYSTSLPRDIVALLYCITTGASGVSSVDDKRLFPHDAIIDIACSHGTKEGLCERLDVSLNEDGTLKPAALEWEDENSLRKYPFDVTSSLINSNGFQIPLDMIQDINLVCTDEHTDYFVSRVAPPCIEISDDNGTVVAIACLTEEIYTFIVSGSPRYDHTAVTIGNTMYVYGGLSASDTLYGSDIEQIDLFALSGFTVTPVDGASPLPGNRFNHTAAVDSQGRMYVFGGSDSPINPGAGLRNDLWRFDLATNFWTELYPNSPDHTDPNAAPLKARHGHTMVYIQFAFEEFLVIYGGYGDTGGGSNAPLSDVWIYNITADSWEFRGSGVPPGARFDHAAAIDENRKMIVFGGTGNSSALDDIWSYETSTNVWEQLAPGVTNKPSKRHSHTMVVSEENEAIVFGGYNTTSGHLRDAWAFNLVSDTWEQREDAPLAVRRSNHTAVNRPNDNMMFIFAGQREGFVEVGELWQYNIDERIVAELNDVNGSGIIGNIILDFSNIPEGTDETFTLRQALLLRTIASPACEVPGSQICCDQGTVTAVVCGTSTGFGGTSAPLEVPLSVLCDPCAVIIAHAREGETSGSTAPYGYGYSYDFCPDEVCIEIRVGVKQCGKFYIEYAQNNPTDCHLLVVNWMIIGFPCDEIPPQPPTPPVANIELISCREFQFFGHASTSGGVPVKNWFWSFGDGFTSNDQNPLHVYAQPGIYTVTLTITDVNGAVDTDTIIINVE